MPNFHKIIFSSNTACVLFMVASFLVLPYGQSAVAQNLDLNEIFRCVPSEKVNETLCGEARDLIIDNCTICHAFVPIVMQQFDEQGWDGLFDRHADRSPQLSVTQVADMKKYLAENFNSSLDPPELPPALLDLWTSY